MTIETPTLFNFSPGDSVENDDCTPLLPVRHPNQDLFICDVLDAIPKDDMATNMIDGILASAQECE